MSINSSYKVEQLNQIQAQRPEILIGSYGKNTQFRLRDPQCYATFRFLGSCGGGGDLRLPFAFDLLHLPLPRKIELKNPQVELARKSGILLNYGEGLGMLTLIVSSQHWLAKLGGAISAFIAGLGGLGVMILAIGDSSFLSVPEGNDLLIVILSTGKSWGNMAYYVGMTIMGSIIGCLLLYTVGRKGGSPILRRKFSQQKIERAERLFEKYGLLAVLIPSILPPPTPFKIFVLSAGVFRLKVLAFLSAVFIGRTIRYSMWGILAVLYGNSVKFYMQKNLNLVGMILFGVFALIIAATLVYWRRRIRMNKSGEAS